ncbi:MAG: cation-transporting P-type ATPase [Candidatus Woesearchaeota archaeon]
MIGLQEEVAKELLKKYGYNDFGLQKDINALKIFFEQFKDITLLILFLAAFLSFLIQETLSGIIILIIIIMLAFFGFLQEYSSEKAMKELEKVITPEIIVFRDGVKKKINIMELVPGDVIELKQGDIVPADCILLRSDELYVNESAITGESVDVYKKEIDVEYEQVQYMLFNNNYDFNNKNESFLYAGTQITVGNGLAVVVKTGKNTEFGKIAKHLKEEKDRSVFHQHFENLSKKASIWILTIIIFLYVFKLYQGGFNLDNIAHATIFAIALAVAAIPEGLPIVVTISFALAAKRMAKKNAIIRKFSVIDSLGSLTTICTDKTGTITKNQLTLKESYIPKKEPYYDLKKDNEFLKCILFSQNAEIIKKENKEEFIGNSIDVALLKFLKKINFYERYKVIRQIHFDPKKKYSMNIVEYNDKKESFIKGAPENILNLCEYYRDISNNTRKLERITPKIRNEIQKVIDMYTENGYHTIGFAKIEEGKTIFIGLVGFEDEIREEVKVAIKECYDAGINIILITGDHLNTAKKIAKDAGLKIKDCLTGDEISKMSLEELQERIKNVTICARVKPEDKYKIVQALKNNGEIVAMTGDGINDAAALKKADVGIAVGSGTQVAIQSSDVVLKDDNFATLYEAIKEGRFVFFNLRKYVGFQFSINFAEIFLLVLSAIFLLPTPLSALHLLFINLILDDIIGISLTQLSPDSKNITKKPSKKLLDKPLPFLIFSFGSSIALLSFAAFLIGLNYSLEIAQTYTFLVLSFLGVLRVISFSNIKEPFLKNALNYKELTLNAILALSFIMFLYLTLFLLPDFPKILFLLLFIILILSIVIQDLIKKQFIKEEYI